VLTLVLAFVFVAVVVVVFVLTLVLAFVFVAVLVVVVVLVLVFVLVLVLVLVLFVVVLLVVSNEFCSQNSVPAVQSGFSGSFSADFKATEPSNPTNIHTSKKAREFFFIFYLPL
jgi:hypothetical protein